MKYIKYNFLFITNNKLYIHDFKFNIKHNF